MLNAVSEGKARENTVEIAGPLLLPATQVCSLSFHGKDVAANQPVIAVRRMRTRHVFHGGRFSLVLCYCSRKLATSYDYQSPT